MKTFKCKLVLGVFFLIFTSIAFSQTNSKELKDVYEFDYIYKLKISNNKDDFQFDYYLKKDAGYFGFDLSSLTQDQKDMKMFTIIDNDTGTTGMFMEMMGKKMVQKSKIKLSDFDSEIDDSEFTVTEIGSKTILGFNCQGFIMENKDSKSTVYITDEAPVSFSNIWNNGKTKMPKGFNERWMEKYAKNGLMMEMEYTDKKKKKNNMTMQCVGLEKTDFILQASDYGSMLSAFGK